MKMCQSQKDKHHSFSYLCVLDFTVPLSDVHVCKVKGETKLTRGTKGQMGGRRARRSGSCWERCLMPGK